MFMGLGAYRYRSYHISSVYSSTYSDKGVFVDRCTICEHSFAAGHIVLVKPNINLGNGACSCTWSMAEVRNS